MSLNTRTIRPEALEVLPEVYKLLPKGSYLAGGTALAMHLQHRTSYDLDLYNNNEFSVEQLAQRFEKELNGYELTSTSWQTIHGRIENVEISFFVYKYKLLKEFVDLDGVKIASIEDIAAMKVEAISGRGLKRDFFDIYSICKQTDYTLGDILELNLSKYERNKSNLNHIFKSFAYFDDAEKYPERTKEVEAHWVDVKNFFERETNSLLKLYL